MCWGHGMGGWGMVLLTIGTLLFWGLVIAGIVALVRYTGRGRLHGGGSTATRSTPQEILAERFAHGEIDEEDYRRRLAILGVPAKTRAGG